eukprot:TRINITY_DN7456_c0_g1_i1.p1 TRINITY_DN7456_c0_g1~~TRINITY_DN7456_c0_g1_i1.p1  ORF type:complete len:342 (+),score=122.98 TRINITY_DN7456_c0_g1_i1:366-1391(+)
MGGRRYVNEEKTPLTVQKGYSADADAAPEGGEGAPERRVLPVPSPPRMGAAALEAIGTREKLHVRQLPSKLEGCCACCCCARPNKYDVYDAATKERVFWVEEESGCRHRCCCNPNHALQLELYDKDKKHVLATMDRPFRMCGFCPAWGESCQQEGVTYAKDLTDAEGFAQHAYGSVKQPICGGCFVPKLNVALGALNPQEYNFAEVHGPTFCYGGCTELCREQKFYISSPDAEFKEGDLGVIVKERPDPEDLKDLKEELKTCYDEYSIAFTDSALTPHQRLTLLSSLLLVDYMFFERSPDCGCGCCPPTVKFTVCNFYVCGAICPLSLKIGHDPLPSVLYL